MYRLLEPCFDRITQCKIVSDSSRHGNYGDDDVNVDGQEVYTVREGYEKSMLYPQKVDYEFCRDRS